MGNTCTGCNCNKEGNEPSELLTVDNKVCIKLDNKWLVWEGEFEQFRYGKFVLVILINCYLQNVFKRNLKSIITIQAWFRGTLTRKRVSEHLK